MFHRKYDKSLSLILCNHGSNRDMIENFINNIPSRLYDRLYKSILYLFNNFSNLENFNISKYDEILLSSECRTLENKLYWYMINPQTQALNLGECIIDGEEQHDVFQMTLYPLDDFQVYHMENFDRLLLGEISYDFVDQKEENTSDCVTNKVDLVKYPLVGFAVCSSLDNERVKHYDLVNINNYLDIQNTIKVDKHTRSRKKF